MEFDDPNDGSKVTRSVDLGHANALSPHKKPLRVAELLQFHQNHTGNTNVVEWRYEMRRVMQVI